LHNICILKEYIKRIYISIKMSELNNTESIAYRVKVKHHTNKKIKKLTAVETKEKWKKRKQLMLRRKKEYEEKRRKAKNNNCCTGSCRRNIKK